ncbi:N-acyl homoserine lactonase AiiB [Agrobacterium vitis]|uniref:quorum-quenching N-acyl-homoserine lactonase n=1 Tax=Agrobacterium vitis TaxID=373 RepID=A0AAE5AY31_AGRVI|nr:MULTISPECIES: N-acyl homoserine lactonase AiiB [Rhizobium/Agrobacterium group]MCF1501052.1 N-acyl homoserine lactonase AiiB [Allorhizobium sp. Av2]MCF1475026.1 N-acyl homoserine lactonase AiiB [Allorhizobium ampelinum]MCM2442579.1 N-acyl homoserine lactonase AiiB [Agrobacterium vitis]MUZ60096.1 N-acyl homoserine lactonase AiiB [Agrobacterium vitis]MVA67391.1 N-acyl homoserine lactonase AiiB [Agrobacterium vitis]
MGNKLFVLDLGEIRVDENFIIANSTFVTPQKPTVSSRLIDIPVSAYLIQCTDATVLYDTGCHPECMGTNGRWPAQSQLNAPYIGASECNLPERLRQLGLSPDEISTVVLSHLHNDHAGCVEYFGKSRLIAHEDEFATAVRYFATGDHSSPYIVKDIEAWFAAPRNWDLVSRDERERELAPGVTLLNFGSGHAAGMLGIAVELEKRPGFLLVSDACYTATNYGPPARRAGVLHDTIGYDRTVSYIRKYAESRSLKVLFGHDREQFASLIKSTDGFYE